MFRKILLALLIALVAIQFFPGAKNQNNDQRLAIQTVYPVPEEVQQILKQSCNDCHSNYTSYPWYSRVQPLGWWLNHHVNEGKEKLNFSVFATYPAKKQAHKLEEVAEVVEKAEMPLNSYLWIHRDADLNPQQKEVLISWARQLQYQIENK